MARTQRSYPTWDDEFEPRLAHGPERRHPESEESAVRASWGDDDDDWDGDDDDGESDDDWSEDGDWQNDEDPWIAGDGPLRRGEA
jgi:hypothetical protein